MIRRILTTLFCAVSFFLLVFVIPVRAFDPFTTNFICRTFEAGMVAVKYAEVSEMDALVEKSRSDPEFECSVVDLGYAYWAIELVHTYRAVGVFKGMVLSLDAKGVALYTFWDMDYIRLLLHEPKGRGV